MTKLPRKEPKLRKFYFAADTPDGLSKAFQKHAYQLLADKTLVLIYYLGDEKSSVAWGSTHFFHSTSPSMLTNLTCSSYQQSHLKM